MRLLVLATCFLGLIVPALADDSVDYMRRIKPVLQARCYACHGVLKQEAGLRLDSAALALKGGSTSVVIKPGDASGSSLLKRISSTDDAERMPPEGEPLKTEEIAAIRDWIVQGATAPADEQSERDPREHWAFQTPVRPKVPLISWGVESEASKTEARALLVPGRASSGTSGNPIDAFIAAKHLEMGLKPQPAADKRIWLRRVTLDLIGLPPTKDELDAFLADDSTAAIDKVVNRLLDSPHYGERWGRHWMDIWRYSDWWGLGAESRNSQKHIWHWRDWIVESLNADHGYDQMLREMLAADELYPEDLDRLRAGGFLARQYFKFNRTSWLDETIEHTAKAMLGLTFNCAKCHDHKYDPVSQADYYRFRAIFEPYQVRVESINGQIDFEKDGIPRPFDCNLDAKTFIHIRGDDRNPDTTRIIVPAFPAFLSQTATAIEPISLPTIAVHPGLRPVVVEAYLKQAEQQIVAKRTEVAKAREMLVKAEQLEAIAAAKTGENQRQTGQMIVRDDFSAARPDDWEFLNGNWVYADGKLSQSEEGAVFRVLQLKTLPPTNFEAKLKFVPTGGQTWKSVGIVFDATGSNEFLAYLSAYALGPKAQFAYKQGSYVYPGEAGKAHRIELNQPYELTLRVRGTLVNLAVNGEQLIAYQLPLARQRGPLQIVTYDAKADFQSFELAELADNVVLVEAMTDKQKGNALLPVDQSKLALQIAEKVLTTAELQPAEIRARAMAETARYLKAPDGSEIESARAAAKAERTVAAAKAEEAVLRAELDSLQAAAKVVAAATDKKAELETKLTASRTSLENARKGLEPARKAIDEPSETYTPIRGALKVLESNLEKEESRLKPFPTTSTGRRTALARWITDPRHPLTARVAVNHIWSRHFGKPLVPTVFDFGRKGTAPTHPELLDWLAMEMMQGGQGNSGWGMKHIHRLIVTSNAYRMTSTTLGTSPENLVHDPDNRFYWRMNPIRMESQVVRDSLLSLAGELDLTMGGPSIPISNEASRRRSIYFVHSNIEHEKFLSMFDDASVLDCYRRAESIVPLQALALENSPLAAEMSAKIAKRIADANPAASDAEFVRQAFLTVLSVEPSETEITAVIEGMKDLVEAAKRANRNVPVMNARIGVVSALLNHNDFVVIR